MFLGHGQSWSTCGQCVVKTIENPHSRQYLQGIAGFVVNAVRRFCMDSMEMIEGHQLSRTLGTRAAAGTAPQSPMKKPHPHEERGLVPSSLDLVPVGRTLFEKMIRPRLHQWAPFFRE